MRRYSLSPCNWEKFFTDKTSLQRVKKGYETGLQSLDPSQGELHPSLSNTGQARLAGQTGKAGEPTGKGSQEHAAQK